jgi:chromosomal replication initiator protein
MENKPAGKEKPITVNLKEFLYRLQKSKEARPVIKENNINPFVVPGIRKVNIDSNLKPISLLIIL